MGIKIAVRALADAVRDVDVERKRLLVGMHADIILVTEQTRRN
jgi:hypothetical protein